MAVTLRAAPCVGLISVQGSEQVPGVHSSSGNEGGCTGAGACPEGPPGHDLTPSFFLH